MKNIDLVKQGKYKQVNKNGLLDEIDIIVNDEVEYLKLIVNGLSDNDSSLKSSLNILIRDMDNLNDQIFRYLYDN